MKEFLPMAVLVTIGLALFGYLVSGINRLGDRVDSVSMSISQVRSDLSSVKTDVSWIKDTIGGPTASMRK